jgi:hypothetical protein
MGRFNPGLPSWAKLVRPCGTGSLLVEAFVHGVSCGTDSIAGMGSWAPARLP